MNNIYLNRLLKAGAVLLMVLALYVLVLAINGLKENKFIGGGVGASNIITVSGDAEVVAIPDVATFTFTVSEEQETVGQAQKGAAEEINKIIDFLEDEDIEERDIKTLSFNVFPRYEFQRDQIVCVTHPCPQPPSKRVLVGYVVEQRILVKVRDIEAAGTILAGVGNFGASNISNLNFTIDEEEVLQEGAREQAIDAAREKAKRLAGQLNVRLVRVVGFSEGGRGFSQPQFARAELASFDSADEFVAPELPVGENTITAQVHITYEIR